MQQEDDKSTTSSSSKGFEFNTSKTRLFGSLRNGISGDLKNEQVWVSNGKSV